MSFDGAKEEIKNLLDYNKYEDYVDTFICPADLKFLQVKKIVVGVFFLQKKNISNSGH